MKKPYLKLFVPLCALALAVSAAADSVVEDIIARVNDQIISRSELQKSKEELRKELQQQNVPEAEIEKREKDVLRDLIDQQLLIQKGNDLGISADAEVVKRLDEMRKQMNLETMEDLEKAASEQGVNFEDYKQKMKNDIIMQRVVSEEVGRRVGGQVTPTEVQKYYEAHKQDFDQPEQVALREILISTDKSAKNPSDDEQQRQAAAKAKADEVEQQLKSGAKFEDLAKKYSDGTTAGTGGELGVFKRGQLAPELESKVFALDKGQYTEPLLTKQGYIILQVAIHVKAGIPPLEDVRNAVENALYSEKMQPALRQYLTQLREDAYIDIKPGFVDTGASPNETRPTYTTASDAGSRPLKKKKKHLLIF